MSFRGLLVLSVIDSVDEVWIVFDDALRYDTALGKALAAGSSG